MIFIRNATIHRISEDPIEGGAVTVEGGKLSYVGADKAPPSGAEVIDGAGGHLVPGLVDAHCHVGVTGEGMGRRFGDGNEVHDPIQPHLRVRDAIWHDDPAWQELLSSGVTTVWVTPGSVNPFAGTGVALKTVPGTVDERILAGSEGMKMALGENPKRVHHNLERYPNTRMGVAGIMREQLFLARAYGRKETREYGEADFKLASLQPMLRGEMKARIHAHRADDIVTAVRLAEEFGLDPVIEHASEGYMVKDFLAEKNVPCVLGPHMSGRSKPETANRTLRNAALLHEAGVKVAIQTDAGSAAQFLMVHAAMAVREGLDRVTALRAVTLNAAEICGIGDRVGSIDPGKDGDLVLFERDPFDLTQKPRMVVVNGEIVAGGA